VPLNTKNASQNQLISEFLFVPFLWYPDDDSIATALEKARHKIKSDQKSAPKPENPQ